MIIVKEWMSAPVKSMQTGTTVYEAAKLMDKLNIGSIIVSEDGKLAEGIVTERDILKKVVAEGKDPSKVKIEDIMTKKVASVLEDAKLLEVSKLMTENSFRRVLVCNSKKEIKGIVTSKDLLELMSG